MSMAGDTSPSITKANSSQSFKQVHHSEGELARANVGAVSKWGIKLGLPPGAIYRVEENGPESHDVALVQ
jgi:hypothetical protein